MRIFSKGEKDKKGSGGKEWPLMLASPSSSLFLLYGIVFSWNFCVSFPSSLFFFRSEFSENLVEYRSHLIEYLSDYADSVFKGIFESGMLFLNLYSRDNCFNCFELLDEFTFFSPYHIFSFETCKIGALSRMDEEKELQGLSKPY